MNQTNDALLTAYAFGELEGDELAQAEALFNADPAARAEVESLRVLGGKMSLVLATEPIPRLNAAESTPLSPDRKLVRKSSRSPSLRWSLQIAAAIAAGVALDRFALPRKSVVSVNSAITEQRAELPTSGSATPLPSPHPGDLRIDIPSAQLASLPTRNPLSPRVSPVLASAIAGPPTDLQPDSIDGPRPGDKIYYYSPDPKFEHLTSYSGRRGHADLIVSVPEADIDRGFVIWAEPKGQSPANAKTGKAKPVPGEPKK